MISRVSSLKLIDPPAAPVGQRPADDPGRADDLLDESGPFAGMGRSLSFPFAQYRARDAYRTVYFDEGRGQTVVLVHGLGANLTHWEPVARSMVRRYRLVGLDLVGLGWSDKPHVRYTVELLRDHLLSFLDRQGIGRAHLVGHSMGGAVCLAAALARPDQFDSLTLVCAAGVAPLPRWMQLAAPIFLRKHLLYHTLVLTADLILDNVFVDSEHENEHVRWFRRSAMRDDPGYPNLWDFARVCESLCRDVARRDYSPHFSSFPLPVLGLWGDSDRLTVVPSVLRALDELPRARKVILNRCGHMPMVERPEETLFHLERFLQHPP